MSVLNEYHHHRAISAALARFLALLFVLVGSTGCDRDPPSKKPTAPQTTAQTGGTEEKAAGSADRRVLDFGGPHVGFVDWLERDGRFVVLHRFTRDTDGDGSIDPRLGDHGEPEGDAPVVTTVDLRTGETLDWDELLATDPQGRWALLRRDEEVVAMSAGRKVTLEGADVTADPSPCMPARQASIEPSGTWVSFVRNEPERVVVRHLGSGTEREYPAQHTLWRGDPTPLGWAMLREVVEDTDGDGELKIPVRKGSCVCRWCSRFSKSVGSAGFAGDDFESFLVTPDGERHEGLGQPLPVARGLVWSLSDNELKKTNGETAQLGPRAGCRLLALPVGSGKLVLRCGSDTLVWDPESGETTSVEPQVDALELFAPPRSGWVAVRIRDEDGGTRLGRLSVESGVVEPGPPARRFGPPHPSGWLLAADDETIWAFDIHSGESTELTVSEGALLPLTVKSGDAWHVPDPGTGEVTTLKRQPVFVASNGCYVEPHEMTRPTKGPFRWVCPK